MPTRTPPLPALARVLLLVPLALAACHTPGPRSPDAADLRAARLVAWVADEYVPPFPDFSDAEKYYYPRALARMARYGSGDARSNFGDPAASDRPPEMAGILDFRGRPANAEGGKPLPGFVDKDPFHFILLGMSRLLFAYPDAPAMAANRDAFLRAGLDRTDNFNAFTAEGTENHINMSRTAGYIYAVEATRDPDQYPEAPARAERMRDWLLDWSRRLYRTGDGEWNSSIYAAYNMAGWFNVYDFTAPGARGADPGVHAAARAVLDYYAAQLALHYSWGLVGGAEMRGHGKAGDYAALTTATDYINWMWFADGTGDPPGGFRGAASAAIYAALSDYRPPLAVVALAREKHLRPNDHLIASPGYLMSRSRETLRTFHAGRHHTLGSAAMPVGGWVSSAWQIVNWKLLARDPEGGLPRLVWGNGGFRGNEAGNVRNPWDQFAQHGPVLVQMTRVPENAEEIEAEIRGLVDRWKADWDADFSRRWPRADRGGFRDGFTSIHFLPGDLATAGRNRIYFPPGTPVEREGEVVFLDLDPVYLAVRSLRLDAPARPAAGVLEDAGARGELAGLLVEVGEAGTFADLAGFREAVLARTGLDRSGLAEGRLAYTNLSGERIVVEYEMAGTFLEPEYDMAYGVTEPVAFLQDAGWIQPDWPRGEGHGRVPALTVDGERIFPRRGLPHVSGPLLQHADSVMRISAAGRSYGVDYSGSRPEFRDGR